MYIGQLATPPSARAYEGTRSVGKAVTLDRLCDWLMHIHLARLGLTLCSS